MSNIKTFIPELSIKAKRIVQLQEQLKEFNETHDAILAQKEIIKAAQEEIKALQLADDFFNELSEELKALSKEMKEGAKQAVKGTNYKPAEYVAYVKALVKEKETDVIMKGSVFNSIKQQTGV